jgi:hypothetical protein
MAGHSWDTSLQPSPQESTKLHLKAPRRPGLLLPYKRAGQSSTRKGGDKRTDKARRKPEAMLKRAKAHTTHISTSQAICLYSHSPFETWARFPLSQLVTPTQALRCKEIQYSPLPTGRRAFSYPNQDKSPCILFASPSRLGTRSTHSVA